jgi:hypothetical protein
MFKVMILATLLIGAEAKADTTPLEFGHATVKNDGSLEVIYTVCKPVYENRQKTVAEAVSEIVNGKPVTRTVEKVVTYQVVKPVFELCLRPIPADQFRVWRDGKAVDAKTAAGLLKMAETVAYCEVTDLNGAAPSVPSVLAPGTLVVAINYASRHAPPPIASYQPPVAPAPPPSPAAFLPVAPAPCPPPGSLLDRDELGPVVLPMLTWHPARISADVLVPGRLDAQGRLVLRQHMEPGTPFAPYQLLEVPIKGQKHSFCSEYPVSADVETTIPLDQVAAVDLQGRPVDGNKLAASLPTQMTPLIVRFREPSVSKPAPPPGPVSPDAALECAKAGIPILTVPYPLIGSPDTTTLDLDRVMPPSPRFARARSYGDGRIVVQLRAARIVTALFASQLAFPVGTAEKPVFMTKSIYHKASKFVFETGTFDASHATFSDVLGKPVDAEVARKRLTKGASVLVAADQWPVHPFYLRAVQPDTLVIRPGLPNKPVPDSPSPPPPPVPPAPRAPIAPVPIALPDAPN